MIPTPTKGIALGYTFLAIKAYIPMDITAATTEIDWLRRNVDFKSWVTTSGL